MMGWVRKTLLALGLICLGVGLGGSWIVYSAADGFISKGDRSEISKQANVQDIKRIVIRSDFPDVKFVKSNDNDAHFTLTGVMNERTAGVELNAIGGTLSADISFGNKINNDRWFQFDPFELVQLINGSFSKLRLEIALPDRQFEEISLESDVGDIDVDYAIRADRLQLQTEFGDITVRTFEGEVLELNTDAGDIEAFKLAANRKVEASTSFGDVDLSFDKLPEESRLETNAGDITAKVPKSSEPRLDLQNDLGKIRVDVPGLNFRTQTKRSVVTSDNTAGPKITARSEFGDIDVLTR